MKYFLSLFFTLLLALNSFTQNKDKVNIYLNEEFQTIERDEFKKKKKSYIYHEKIIKTDSGKLHVLKLNEEFGTLNDSLLIDLKKMLKKEYNFKLDQTTVIHFRDTLFSYSAIRKYRKPYFIHRMINGDTVEIRTTPSIYFRSRTEFDNHQKKCAINAKANNIKHLYLYETDFNDTYIYNNINWQKINSQLRKLFFQNKSSVVILKPNGLFYKYIETADSWVEAVIDFKDWNILIDDFNEAKKHSPKKPKIRFKYKRPPRTKGQKITITQYMNKKEIREAFEANALSHPAYKSCFSSGY
ncbi:hypothetical protein [Winogradskyella sp. MH6]|uniref:hypothetical protein n=1 Tax=Winogradskyella sp. MH6 TaxID=2929510 RepID=UPI001FB32F07|nr:hypothetical protein [Winogradskyella sp. MH6]